jgi:integrase
MKTYTKNLLISVRDWINSIWVPQVFPHYKASTQKLYSEMLKRTILPNLGHLLLCDINQAAITPWFENYSLTSPGSANKALDILSSALGYAVKTGAIDYNPASGIRRNKRQMGPRILNQSERRRLLAELSKVRPQSRTQALAVKFLLYSGCRRNEVFHLRWSEVSETEKKLYLTDSKTGRKVIWLSDQALAVLREALAAQKAAGIDTKFVFPQVMGKEEGLGNIDRFWRNIKARAGIKSFTLHSLRRCFASEALRQGVDLKTLSKMLGHSHVRTTMCYLKVFAGDLKAAAERIGKYFAALTRRDRDGH